MEEKRIYYVGIDHGNHLMKHQTMCLRMVWKGRL